LTSICSGVNAFRTTRFDRGRRAALRDTAVRRRPHLPVLVACLVGLEVVHLEADRPHERAAVGLHPRDDLAGEPHPAVVVVQRDELVDRPLETGLRQHLVLEAGTDAGVAAHVQRDHRTPAVEVLRVLGDLREQEHLVVDLLADGTLVVVLEDGIGQGEIQAGHGLPPGGVLTRSYRAPS
jgi:hypothetical protein